MIITMTKIITYLIASVLKVLKVAIWCNSGLFIAYIGLPNINFLDVTGAYQMINWSSLFSVPTHLPLVIVTIITLSLIGMFDTFETIIGAGREMNLFNDAEIEEMKTGKRFHTGTEHALVTDATATTVDRLEISSMTRSLQPEHHSWAFFQHSMHSGSALLFTRHFLTVCSWS